ncbi:MAG: hypothetical protein Ta2E_10450 [Mycoplasmoidaceae bacterium]|nr:MAG: hypothetical protein Ta2E_10450 [Mycoplasmoidaceae bacterium]
MWPNIILFSIQHWFTVLLGDCLPENRIVNLDYFNRIYFQGFDLLCINFIPYNVSLLCGIKQYKI